MSEKIDERQIQKDGDTANQEVRDQRKNQLIKSSPNGLVFFGDAIGKGIHDIIS